MRTWEIVVGNGDVLSIRREISGGRLGTLLYSYKFTRINGELAQEYENRSVEILDTSIEVMDTYIVQQAKELYAQTYQ